MTAVCTTSSGVSRPKTSRVLSTGLALSVALAVVGAAAVAEAHAAPQDSTGMPPSDELKQLRQKGEQGDQRPEHVITPLAQRPEQFQRGLGQLCELHRNSTSDSCT